MVPASEPAAAVLPSPAERPETELTQDEAVPIPQRSSGPPPLPPQAEEDSAHNERSTFLSNDWSRATVAESHRDRPVLIVLIGFYSAIQTIIYFAAFFLLGFSLLIAGAYEPILADVDMLRFSGGSMFWGLLPLVPLAITLLHAAVCYGLFTIQEWSVILASIAYGLSCAFGVLQILSSSSGMLRVAAASQVAIALAVIWYLRQPTMKGYFRR
jgi:hypothetical protein